MKTLSEYTNRNKNRVDEAISKGVIDMDAVQKQMRSIVSYFNTHVLGLVERQLKETKKYLETANDRHVQQVVEDWMKKKGYGYATEVAPGSKDWWELYSAVMDKVYKYDTPLWFEIIEPDETWSDEEEKKCLNMAKKIAGIK
jgi:hypothetical protein